MLKLTLDNFQVTYDKESNKGSIQDNGFSIEFSMSVEQGIISEEPLDIDIKRKLNSLVLPYVKWECVGVFNKENWNNKTKGGMYCVPCVPFNIRCYISARAGTIETSKVINRFAVDFYGNIITEFDMSLKSLELIKEVFNDCEKEECGRIDKVEEGPYGGAFRDWDDYYTWKNGSLTL